MKRKRRVDGRQIVILGSALALVLGCGTAFMVGITLRVAPLFGGGESGLLSAQIPLALLLLAGSFGLGAVVGGATWVVLAAPFLSPEELRFWATQPEVPLLSGLYRRVVDARLRLRDVLRAPRSLPGPTPPAEAANDDGVEADTL